MEKRFAIIGYWEDSGQVYSVFASGEDGHAALRNAAGQACVDECGGVLFIAAVEVPAWAVAVVTVPCDGATCEVATAEDLCLTYDDETETEKP